MTGHVARAEVIVEEHPSVVWTALTDPEQVRSWMVGTTLTTDWQVGSPITWQGEIDGTPYEDKGEVLEADAPRRLSMTHYSPLMGQEDRPENYHTVTYTLTPTRDGHDGGARAGRQRLAGAGRAVLAELAADAGEPQADGRVLTSARPPPPTDSATAPTP